MTPDDLTPDEFARLLSLPEDHPDRVKASESPAFEARVALLQKFVTATLPALSSGELKSSQSELRSRVANIVHSADAASAPATIPPDAREKKASWLQNALLSLRGYGARVAFGVAAIIVIAAGGIQLMRQAPTARPVRGTIEAEQVVLDSPRYEESGVTLSWRSALKADAYRVEFYGSDLREIARLDDVKQPRVELNLKSLPAGLARGTDVMVEVVALRGGDPIGKSGTRAFRIPNE